MSRTLAPLTLPVKRSPPVGFASPQDTPTAARVAMAIVATNRMRMCGVLECGLSMRMEGYGNRALHVGAETHDESGRPTPTPTTGTGHPDRGRSNLVVALATS